MTVLRTVLVTVLFVTVFVAAHVWTRAAASRTLTTIETTQPLHSTSVLDTQVPALHVRENDWTEPRVDLNGNEVDAAVGDYRVDGRGDMYERHAPDTALLHLGVPRS